MLCIHKNIVAYIVPAAGEHPEFSHKSAGKHHGQAYLCQTDQGNTFMLLSIIPCITTSHPPSLSQCYHSGQH